MLQIAKNIAAQLTKVVTEIERGNKDSKIVFAIKNPNPISLQLNSPRYALSPDNIVLQFV